MPDSPRMVQEAADGARRAVEALCSPTSVLVILADGVTRRTWVDPLWDQAVAAVGMSREGFGGVSASASRPPLDIDLADFVNDVRQATVFEARARRLTPRNVVLDDLRQIVEHEAVGGSVNTLRLWEFKVLDWAAGARRRLGLVDEQPATSIRDATCPSCGQSHVSVVDPTSDPRLPLSERPVVLEPALILPSPPDPIAECRSCGQTWAQESLHDLRYGIDAVRAAEPREPAGRPGALIPTDPAAYAAALERTSA